MKFKIGALVRRRVDGVVMVIVDVAKLRLSQEAWTCAWMDGHRRRTDEFTEYEIDQHEPGTIEGTATEITPLRAVAKGG